MSTIQDEMNRVAGVLTIQDASEILFSRAVDETVQDAEFRWLGEVPRLGTGDTIADRWKTIAIYGGADKHINDIKFDYWSAQPSA